MEPVKASGGCFDTGYSAGKPSVLRTVRVADYLDRLDHIDGEAHSGNSGRTGRFGKANRIHPSAQDDSTGPGLGARCRYNQGRDRTGAAGNRPLSPRNCRVDKGVPAADASVWLDAKPDLIRKAQAM